MENCMRRIYVLLLGLLLGAAGLSNFAVSQDSRTLADTVVTAADRSPEDRALDAGRKPAELLVFLGVQPGWRVADLGAGNTPLDIVSYKRDGEDYLLISNTRHPLIRIACKDIDGQETLTQPKEPLGVPRENMPQQGVSRMANLNGSYVLMMQRDEGGDTHLRSYANASL